VHEIVIGSNAILGAAALVTSITGFGYALVATPFLVLIMPPRSAVALVLISWLPLAALLVRDSFGDMSPGRIGRLLLVAIPGVPVGVYGLTHLGDDTMRGVIGAVTLAAAVTLVARPGRPFVREGLAQLGVGLTSGLLSGASAMGGPPVVLLGLKQGWEHRGFRADLIGYFVVLHLFVLAAFQSVDLVSGQLLALGLWSQPGVLIGFAVGIGLKRRVSQTLYRWLAIGLVCTGGVLALVRG